MAKYNRLIDVIIPAYNIADAMLFRCLSSIAFQDILSDLQVTIVDDASTTENYEEVANHFRPFMNVQVLRLQENGGPGVARQYGIDHTSNGYLVFIDADDTFIGSSALQCLRLGIEEKNDYQICVSVFDEIVEFKGKSQPLVKHHSNDMTWLHGKIYKRSFIDKYDIRFHPTSRSNEDVGFNMQCRLFCNESTQINFLTSHFYDWHNDNPNSITRQNNKSYKYGINKNDSNYGWIENLIYITEKYQKIFPYEKIKFMQLNIHFIVNSYVYYIGCLNTIPKNAPIILEYYKKYFKQFYLPNEKQIPKEELIKWYNSTMSAQYEYQTFQNIIPQVTLFDYINLLKT